MYGPSASTKKSGHCIEAAIVERLLLVEVQLYATLSSGTPWNIPWVTCSFSVYRQASRQVCIPRKYKWQVEYSMVYHKRALHNYILFFTQFMSRQNSTNPAIWLVPRVGGIFLSGLLTAGWIVMLIYFCEWISRHCQFFVFFTLPSTINQRKFISIHFYTARKVIVSKLLSVLKLWEFVWLFVAQHCNSVQF